MYSAREKTEDARLRKLYGKSLSWRRQQFKKQKGQCWLCRRTHTKGTKKKPPHPLILNVDHNHHCLECNNKPPRCGNCTRGLICMQCNRFVIGAIERFGVPVRAILEYFSTFDPGNPVLREIEKWN